MNEIPVHGGKVAAWCRIGINYVIDLYCFDDAAVTGQNYKNMLESYDLTQLNKLTFPYILEQHGAEQELNNRITSFMQTVDRICYRMIGKMQKSD